jgi:hypothetical protein
MQQNLEQVAVAAASAIAPAYASDVQVCALLGISPSTHWRALRSPETNFPTPSRFMKTKRTSLRELHEYMAARNVLSSDLRRLFARLYDRPAYANDVDLARYLDVSRGTLMHLRNAGLDFPEAERRVGGKRTSLDAVDAWMQARRVTTGGQRMSMDASA